MGIVVSGEDGGVGAPNEQQKVNMIAAENDYGLVMATLDQVSVFLGSWWTSSLTGRIQVFTFSFTWRNPGWFRYLDLQKLYPCPIDEYHKLWTGINWTDGVLFCWYSCVECLDLPVYLSPPSFGAVDCLFTKLRNTAFPQWAMLKDFAILIFHCTSYVSAKGS